MYISNITVNTDDAILILFICSYEFKQARTVDHPN